MAPIADVHRSLFALISLASFASADLICGTLGYHNGTNLSNFMGNFFYHGLSTFTLCAAYCQQNERCEAFRYSFDDEADSQYCEFFDTSLDGNFTADPTSSYYYYDIGCSFPAFETPKTVTSSKFVTVTSVVAVTSMLPAVAKTLTVAGTAPTITRTTTVTSTTTQKPAAQIRASTVNYTTSATATVTVTVQAAGRVSANPAVTVTRSLTRTTTAYLRTVTQTRTVTTTQRL